MTLSGMRVLVIADCDDLLFHGEVKNVDLIISLGDVATDYITSVKTKAGAKTVFAVKGNHDLPKPFPEGITDLHLTTLEFSGIVFGGMNGSWKYKPKGRFLYSQEEACECLEEFPPVDIFISHNSPAGFHERDIDLNEHHQGFESLRDYIEKSQPRVLFHGHQHINIETLLGKSRIIGVYGHRYIDL